MKDRNGFSKQEIITALETNFIVTNKQQQPYQSSAKQDFGMFLDNEFYQLQFHKEMAQTSTVLDNLDT